MANANAKDKYKTVLSCSVPLATKELLETKSAITGRTMSDIVTQLINLAFSSKHGLAKRLEVERQTAKANMLLAADEAARSVAKANDEANTLVARVTEEAARSVAKANDEANTLVAHAAREAQRTVAIANSTSELALAKADEAWAGSVQCMCLTWLADYKHENAELANRWLFDHRVFAMMGKSKQWYAGGRCYHAAMTFMASDMLPDKLIAADLVADAETLEVSGEVFDYLLSNYDHDVEQLYASWSSPMTSELGDKFYSILRQADVMYGTKLFDIMRGNGGLGN